MYTSYTQAMRAMEALLLEGRLAFKAGEDPDDCPHPEGSDEAIVWELGYDEAEEVGHLD